MKILKIALFIWVVSFSSMSSAAIITTDLAPNTYITNNGLDWTWASPASWGEGSTLMSPSFHDGWRYATLVELDYLDTIVDLFFDGQQNPIQSVQYWNTNYTHVDTGNWLDGLISSGAGTPGYESYWETVYVRDVSAVPLPAAAFLFAPALLGFMGLRRKAKSTLA